MQRMYNFIDFPRIDTKTTRQDFKKLGETAMLKTGNGHDSRNVYSPTGHDGAVKDVVLYKETLLTASGDGSIKVWNCVDWKKITTLFTSTENAVTVIPCNSNYRGSASNYRGNNYRSTPEKGPVTSGYPLCY